MALKQKAAKLLVDCLVSQGVEVIFCLPGAKIDLVFDALLDSPIRMILCRHEQNAGFMAAAYGRITGRPGVVLVTSGPGVGNLTTALLTATTEGDPVVAIGGNVPLNMKLKESHQSTDNLKLMAGVTKAQMEILAPENIPEMIMNAFRMAVLPRAGAVFMSLPQDVGAELTEIVAPAPPPSSLFGAAPTVVIRQAAALLNQAKRPILFLGMEASRPENTQALRDLLKIHPFPVISTYQAAGALSKDLLHLFAGRVGLFRNQPGDQLLDSADVVLMVGFNAVEYDPEAWNGAQDKIILHLDYQPADIHLAYQPKCEILGDIAANIVALAPHITVNQSHSFVAPGVMLQPGHRNMPIHPRTFIHALESIFDQNMTITCDIGSHYIWLARYLLCFEPHRLLFSNGQQTLGVALPWAMATTLARPGEKVISISGDGGFLFSAAELETAVREKMDCVHIVWVDGYYDMVREQQLIKYKRDSAVKLGYVDIVKFAESFGAIGYRINSAAELLPTLKKALAQTGPVLIEVPIDYQDNPTLFESVNMALGG
ncbi:MAG: acetolactate synthase AlsS [Gammaproteobacteria bacterium]|nr:acetolactate synthase AlsS [Gammaproteobacteria bacterium]